jgi:hypothetical protein
VEDPQHVRYEENQQYGSQSYARTPTVTPAAMTVVHSTAAKNQNQDDNQYQHLLLPFVRARAIGGRDRLTGVPLRWDQGKRQKPGPLF